MRSFHASSWLAPIALLASACATGAADDTAGNRPHSGAAGDAGEAADDAGADADDEAQSDAAVDADAQDDAASDDASDGPSEAATDAPSDGANDGSTDAPANPCGADACSIGGTCVESGTPNPSDPCEACLPGSLATGWSKDASNVACDGKPYTTGIARAFAITPYGHPTGISCHNCYASTGASALVDTLAKIHQAQTDGADFIELDLREQSGTVYVQHDDGTSVTGAKLGDVLADSQLKSGDQVLFIELKETTPTDAFLASVLDALVANGYGKAGRPVVLRAFDSIVENVEIARKLLGRAKYASLRPYVRLHVLFEQADGNDVATLQTRVAHVRDEGMHGVEFEYRTPNLFGALAYARSLDLGVNLWTVPVAVGEVFVASLRDQTDVITCDYPVAKARAVVADPNGLLYLDASAQDAAAGQVTWMKTNATPITAAVGSTGRPTLTSYATGSSLFGTALSFDAASQQYLPFYNGANNDPTGGFLVSAVVKFDSLAPASGTTAVILGKADSGAFSLELYQPSAGTGVLRFGVHVGGSYSYATIPTSALDTTSSYLLTGAYDGDGSVWLWVNDSAAQATQGGPVTGGVTVNASRVLLGADPQDGATPVSQQYYFSGKVQMALVQKWAGH